MYMYISWVISRSFVCLYLDFTLMTLFSCLGSLMSPAYICWRKIHKVSWIWVPYQGPQEDWSSHHALHFLRALFFILYLAAIGERRCPNEKTNQSESEQAVQAQAWRLLLWSMPQASRSSPGSIPKRTANRMYSNKNLYMDIHGNTIHSSPKVETTHMSISRWMEKPIGFYPYSGILLGLKR